MAVGGPCGDKNMHGKLTTSEQPTNKCGCVTDKRADRCRCVTDKHADRCGFRLTDVNV